MLDVCLLGCGGMMPLPKRFLTSLLIRHDGSNVLIDCGESTQVALHMSGFSTKNIDHILITHFHGDHVGGLPGLLMTIANNHRTEPLHIWGGQGLARIIRGLTVICGALPFELVIHELSFKERQTFQTGALEWTVQPVKHRVPCLAYSCYLPRGGRFDLARAEAAGIPKQYWSLLQKGESVEVDGHVFQPSDVLGAPRRGLRVSYATDCRPAPALVELVRDSDLFVAEGLYGDPAKQHDAAIKGHMVYSEACRIAAEANVRELWFTHFSPAMINPKEHLEAARKIFANCHVGHNLKMTTLRFDDDA
ncbi:MAG: ribonuclease Z [Peptococcaceae bacterium]|nr:ribonuclease Z [Peptococcaceae bacterium]